MKIFIDTAKINEIEEAFSWGIIDGVTTNPTLIKNAIDELKNKGEKIDIETYIKRILEVAKGCPVSLEVIGTDYESMYREGILLYEKFNKIANNVVIKIPINPSLEEDGNFDGLKTICRLSEQGIPVNVTLIMKVEQAILAAKAGAKYVSPFAGRIDDYLRNKIGWKDFKKDEYYPEIGIKFKDETINDEGIVSGVDLVRKIVEVFNKYKFKTEIIAASIRNSRQVREIAETGCHIATIPFYVLKEMLVHYKTSEGMKKFVSDVVPEYKEIFYK
ncbi:MAG: transaldolase [Candidatus Omnitrophica bacterium]|nr:transaldolase [Candidatus Omnitrophota bacterium]MCM8806710.1 transaldolase [Candidatus Omnitrophota bacterium]